MSTKASGRTFVESDAVAAVFLISYHNLVGGGTGWLPFAEVAYEWLVQTGIHQDQNPKLTLMNMSAPQRLAAKLTMVTCFPTSCASAVPTDLMSFVDSGLISCLVSSSTARRASFPSSNTFLVPRAAADTGLPPTTNILTSAWTSSRGAQTTPYSPLPRSRIWRHGRRARRRRAPSACASSSAVASRSNKPCSATRRELTRSRPRVSPRRCCRLVCPLPRRICRRWVVLVPTSSRRGPLRRFGKRPRCCTSTQCSAAHTQVSRFALDIHQNTKADDVPRYPRNFQINQHPHRPNPRYRPLQLRPRHDIPTRSNRLHGRRPIGARASAATPSMASRRLLQRQYVTSTYLC